MVKRAAGPLMQAIRLDRTSELALPVQIGDALRELVLSGALTAGDRLPATRTLARELGVARATLVECFERLAAPLFDLPIWSKGQSHSDLGSFSEPTLSRHSQPKPHKK